MWNAHYIRKQATRPHVVHGKPWVLYNMPNPESATDHKVPLDRTRWEQLKNIVDLDAIDLDEYLPNHTLTICDRMIEELGGLPLFQSATERAMPWLTQYNRLRTALRQYIERKVEPQLSLTSSPTGSLDYLCTLLQEYGINVNNLDVESEDELDI